MYCCKSVNDGSQPLCIFHLKVYGGRQILILLVNCWTDVSRTTIEKECSNHNHTTTLKPVMYIDLPSTGLSPMGACKSGMICPYTFYIFFTELRLTSKLSKHYDLYFGKYKVYII